MHWDRLFEDLEGQLAAQWEAERAALDAESERLRIAKLTLLGRLRRLQHDEAAITVHVSGGVRLSGRIDAVGADWIAVDPVEQSGSLMVPAAALTGISTHHGAILDTLDDSVTAGGVRARMTLGFVLRDLARRRLAVRVSLTDGDELHGTIDRAGDDHFDLAMHDAGQARLATAVRAFRMVPFAAVRWVRAATNSF